MTSAGAFPVIQTERLQLREVVHGDAPRLFEIHSDRQRMTWWGADPPTRTAETIELIDAWAEWRLTPNPGVRWGLERTADGRFIGTCGLFKWNRDWQSCSTSYELAADADGVGYMTEAMTAVLTWGWKQMSLNRVDALVHPSNAPSRRLLERLGFEREGRLRQAARWQDRYHDLLLMAVLRG